MRKWHAAICCILTWMMPTPTVNFRTQEMGLIPPKFEPTPKTVTPKVDVAKPSVVKVGVAKVGTSKLSAAKVDASKLSATKVDPKSISEFFGQTKASLGTTTVPVKTVDDAPFLKDRKSVRKLGKPKTNGLKPSESQHKMEYAGQPRNLEVSYLKLDHADHELQFNVSWAPAMKGVASEYTLEIRSVNGTNNSQSTNCNAHCYEFPIPANVTSILIPKVASPVEKTCTLRPGCSYIVRLISHPWDGYTSAKVPVNLKDCEAGVCTCRHRSLLPVPKVHTETVIKEGMMYSNISWTLPPLNSTNGLPDKLRKLIYIVSLSERMSISYRNEIYQYTVIRNVTADRGTLVSGGDTTRWKLLPLSKEGGAHIPTVKILAKVSLEDERECIGPAGNATAFDPDTFREASRPAKSKFSFGVYAILGALIGAWAMGAVFVLSARVVKRVLKSFRPAPVSAPLEPLRRRPAWFPLQLRT